MKKTKTVIKPLTVPLLITNIVPSITKKIQLLPVLYFREMAYIMGFMLSKLTRK